MFWVVNWSPFFETMTHGIPKKQTICFHRNFSTSFAMILEYNSISTHLELYFYPFGEVSHFH